MNLSFLVVISNKELYGLTVQEKNNYFKDLSEHDKPKEELDLESIDVLDLKLLGKQLKDLTNGKKVQLPEYNFALGVKEYNDPPVGITEDTIILIEGLHSINDKMTPDLDPAKKFKIFLSPLMPLNIDKHNIALKEKGYEIYQLISGPGKYYSLEKGNSIVIWTVDALTAQQKEQITNFIKIKK